MGKIKKYDFIKEIKIDAYSGYFASPEEKCEEILKISSNWISFKRIKANTLIKELSDGEDIKWDYKTNNPSFEEKYESLCETLLDYNRDSTLRMLDAPGFNITIVFNDKEKKEYHYDGNVNDQEDIGLRKSKARLCEFFYALKKGLYFNPYFIFIKRIVKFNIIIFIITFRVI